MVKHVTVVLTEHQAMAALQAMEECYYETLVPRTTGQKLSRRGAMLALHQALQGTDEMRRHPNPIPKEEP